MKERLILAGRLSAAILAVFLFAACPPEPEPEPEKEYTVSFVVGEGSGSAPASQKIRDGASVILPGKGAMIAPAGKPFAGWKIGSGSTIYKAEDSIKITANTTFTAQWGYTYTVSFVVGEGSGSAPANQTVTGSSVTLPGQGAMIAPAGKPFAGWTIGSGSTIYEDGASVTITEDTVFTAQWGYTYTVSFNAGGGNYAPASQTVISGASVTLPGQGTMTAPAGTMTLVGWKSSSGSTTYQPGDSVTITGTTTFTAQWGYTYTVSFVVGEGSGSAPARQTVTYGANVTLPEQETMIAPAGKPFAGWKSDSDSTTYKAGDSVTITRTTVFTAQWIATYTVSFGVGEGSGTAPTNQTVTAGASVTLPGKGDMTAPSGKPFAGWKSGSG